MHVKLELATDADAAAIAALRMAASRQLTARFGRGTWSFVAESAAGVCADMASARVLVARAGGMLLATLRLSQKQPWRGAFEFFTPAERPLYLTTMAVAPRFQRRGLGRTCLEDAKRLAAQWGAGALRLDAYDAPAGAGDFYRKCGFREVTRAPYNGTPLIFFEHLLPAPIGLEPA